MDPLDAYGDALRRALHAEADVWVPAPDGLERIGHRINALAAVADRAVDRLMRLAAEIRLLVLLLAAVITRRTRRQPAAPYCERRPLQLHPGDVIIARPPNPDHPEHNGEPGRWHVTGVGRNCDLIAIDAIDGDGADWIFCLNLTDPVHIAAKETTR